MQLQYTTYHVKQPMQLLQFIEHALNGVSRSRAKAILSGGGVRVDRKTHDSSTSSCAPARWSKYQSASPRANYNQSL